MSFEGYEQWLCENGHYHVFDVYESPDTDKWRCHCGAKLAWWNQVDQTNNGYRSPDHPEDNYDNVGFVDLKLVAPFEYDTCPLCGAQKIREPSRYEIPEEGCGGHCK